MIEQPPNPREDEPISSSSGIPTPRPAPENGTVFGEGFFVNDENILNPMADGHESSVRGTNPREEKTPVPGLGEVNDGVLYGDSEIYD